MNISWDATDYQQNFSFVPEYGKSVVADYVRLRMRAVRVA